MNLISTTAPIAIQELKKFFEDKNTFYNIDYKNSTLKGAKLLTYLSNLDLPCDIEVDTDTDEFKELLACYLHHPLITNIPLLEDKVIDLLLEFKGIEKVGYADFIEQNKGIITQWSNVLDSLVLFNVFSVNSPELKEYAQSFPINDTSTTEGINFVSILKNPKFYEFYLVVDDNNLQFYKNYFEQNMFKGSSLYSFWANQHNPMFLLTYGIASGIVTGNEYSDAVKNTLGEFEDVTSF